MKYKSEKSCSVAQGNHLIQFPAGVEVEVPAVLEKAVKDAGIQPVGSKKSNAPVVSEAELIAKTVSAMAEIMAKDDPELLTAAGIPRTNEIKKIAGFSPKKKILDEAWSEVEG